MFEETQNTLFLILVAVIVFSISLLIVVNLFAPVPGQLDFIRGLLGFFS